MSLGLAPQERVADSRRRRSAETGTGRKGQTDSHAQARAFDASLETRLAEWHEDETGNKSAPLPEVLDAARASPNRRISDLAREVDRRRKRER